MFLKWGRSDYVGDYSPDLEGWCAGEPQSVSHLYQTCTRVEGAWSWLYAFITSMLPPATLEESECKTLMYAPLMSREVEDNVVWLLGTYYEYVGKEAVSKNRVVGEEELRGHLKARLKAYTQKRTRPLNLPGLN